MARITMELVGRVSTVSIIHSAMAAHWSSVQQETEAQRVSSGTRTEFQDGKALAVGGCNSWYKSCGDVGGAW